MSTGHGETAKRQLDLLCTKGLSSNPNQLKGLLHMVCTFSDDIRMKFALGKCANALFVNDKLSGHNYGVTIGKVDTINCLEDVQSEQDFNHKKFALPVLTYST